MKKSLLRIIPLALLLLSATMAPAVAGEPAPAPAVQPAVAAAPAGCAQQSVDPVAGALGVAPAVQSVPAPLFASHPCPVVRCLYSPCTQNSQCTAAPGGTCNLYCTHPKAGCCAYP
jgi:hypothetical protein